MDEVVFVAGGVGINPIMSMLSYIGGVSPFKPAVRFRVAYASRVPEEGVGKILFLDRISGLLRDGRVNGSLALFLTGRRELPESESEPWEELGHQIHKRRMSQQDLRDLVSDPKRTVVYICGPPVMTDDFKAFLTSPDGLAMDTSQVLLEKWW